MVRCLVQGWFVGTVERAEIGVGAFRAGPFPTRAEALAWEVAYFDGRLAGMEDAGACLAAAQAISRKGAV